jgi:selenophosphate synthase
MPEVSHSIRHIGRWKISLDEIGRELERGKRPEEMVCLGCAAKIPLVETVYPVLQELKSELKALPGLKFAPREDAYFFDCDGGNIELGRGIYSVKDLLAGSPEMVRRVQEDIRKHQPTGLVLLISLTASPTRDQFKRAMLSFFKAVAPALGNGQSLSVGKGHSIQISKNEAQSYIVADYVRAREGEYYGVANNDTIATIDPNLRHSSWISVFVGLNNALNDLFVEGVYKDIVVYPTVDSRFPEEEKEIREALAAYEQRFKELGLRVATRDMIGFNTNSNGATVIGRTEKRGAPNENLRPGDILIATRPVGDLAPLTEYLIRESLGEPTDNVQALRMEVLQWMLIPNVEAAKIIACYLPRKGESYDLLKHITSARDMTGPGILVIEELAQDAGVDVYLHDMKLFADWIADVEMPNPTSGTNGAIVISAHPEVKDRVWKDLERAGYLPWVVGEVAERRGAEPHIFINEALRRYRFLVGLKKGIFENYSFVPARRVAR